MLLVRFYFYLIRKAAEKELETLKENVNNMNEEVNRLNDAISKRDEDLEKSYAAKSKLQVEGDNLLAQAQQTNTELTKTIEENKAAYETEKLSLTKALKDGEEELKKLSKKLETDSSTFESSVKS
jgi:chromosome segregation ATPase